MMRVRRFLLEVVTDGVVLKLLKLVQLRYDEPYPSILHVFQRGAA
jgi:hypothetical protein